MKLLMTLFFVLLSVNSFAATLGESLKPEDCVVTAADKARAAKEFIAATSDDKKKKEEVKTIEK